MIELNLRFHRRVRVWLTELPMRSANAAAVEERVLDAEGPVVAGKRMAALEAMVPTGGRILYGLLGAEFLPSEARSLTVQVDLSPADGESINWSLIGHADQVRAGLPREYLEGVLGGVDSIPAGLLLGAGRLRFNCAAHAAVGSSMSLFRQLTVATVHLLVMDPDSVSEPEIRDLLEQHLSLGPN